MGWLRNELKMSVLHRFVFTTAFHLYAIIPIPKPRFSFSFFFFFFFFFLAKDFPYDLKIARVYLLRTRDEGLFVGFKNNIARGKWPRE